MKVNIVYLPYRRWNFSDLLFKILSKCEFKDFHLTINGNGSHTQDCQWLYESAVNKYGLNASIYTTNAGNENYIDKIRHATTLDYEYSIKLDEDVFLGPQLFDFIFNNLNLLDNDDNLILTPVLSSGIPSCDSFIKNNLSQEEQAEMIRLFGATKIGHAWGVDYSQLNSVLNGAYDEIVFYTAVSKINHYYRGIHPIRVNFHAQKIMNEFVKSNISKFLEKRIYNVEELERPYFCNSVFAIKTKEWSNIVNDRSLFVDAFDEVPLNRYKEYHKKKFLYITNAFAIHTLYNTLFETNDQSSVNNSEQELFKEILNNVKL